MVGFIIVERLFSALENTLLLPSTILANFNLFLDFFDCNLAFICDHQEVIFKLLILIKLVVTCIKRSHSCLLYISQTKHLVREQLHLINNLTFRVHFMLFFVAVVALTLRAHYSLHLLGSCIKDGIRSVRICGYVFVMVKAIICGDT